MPVIQDLLARLNVHVSQMSPSFYRARNRAVTADDIRNLVSVFDVPGKPGFYKVQHRKRFPILTKLSSKHRYPWVWVSKLAFGAAPLTFDPAANFPADHGIESSELALVIGAVSDSRRLGSLFESLDLMATTGWFVPDSEVPRCSPRGNEILSGHEPEAGGSSALPPNAGGITHVYAIAQISARTPFCFF